MEMPNSRKQLQQLAEARIREARLLLNAKEYAGAFHIAGFSVECALKARIAKEYKRHSFPNFDTVRKCWTHNLDELLKQTALGQSFKAAMAANITLQANWLFVSKWGTKYRYTTRVKKIEAINLCDGIDDPTNGVLTWIRAHW